MEGEPIHPVPKPLPREKHPPKGLARKTPLKPHKDVSSFGKSKIPPHPEKALTDDNSALIGHVKATLPTRRGIAPVGKRGKRLAAADKRASEECRGLSCLCGCNLPTMWCHLDGRSEDVRHNPILSVPGCEYLHPLWLDLHHNGVKCRAEMLERAKVKGSRLDHDDVYDLLVEYGYYTYLAERRARE